MIRSLYLGQAGDLQQDVAHGEMAPLVESGLGLLWVDIDDDGDEARALLRDVFHAHQLAIDDCYNGRVDTPKVDDYDTHIFIVTQSIRYLVERNDLILTEVDIFLGPNYVVSSHTGPLEELESLFERACTNEHLVNRGSDMLAQALLDSLVDNVLPAVEQIDEKLDALEEQVLSRPEPRLLAEALALRRHTMRLRRTILPQRDVVNRLSRGEFPRLIRNESRIFYRDIYDHVTRVEEILESIRDVADSVLNTYLSAVNNRMNEVMKTLSVVTAIFLPLTLIASIFGTNLDYSIAGATLSWGFFLMLGSMLLLSALLILYFRNRGWF